MKPRWASILVALALAASACSDSAEPEPEGFSFDLGAATEYRVLTSEEAAAVSIELGTIDGPGEGVQVTGCTLYYPGRYLMELSIQPDVPLDFPATLYVQPALRAGDQSLFLGSAAVEVSRSGAFALPVGLNEFSPITERGRARPLVAVEGGEAIGPVSGCDAAVTAADAPGVVGREPLDGVGLAIQPSSPPDAEEGTIQALARRANWLAEFDPWRALTVIDGEGLELFADRLLLPESGWVLSRVEEQISEGCYRVETQYTQSEAPGLARLLQQEVGCPELDRPDEVVTGGVWDVGVYSDDTTRGALTPFLTWFDNSTPRNPEQRVFFGG